MTPSFPTRRSSDLGASGIPARAGPVPGGACTLPVPRGRTDWHKSCKPFTGLRHPQRRKPAEAGSRVNECDGLRRPGMPQRLGCSIVPVQFFIPHLQPQSFFTFRSEEHTSELQSLMRISYAVFCLKKKNTLTITTTIEP